MVLVLVSGDAGPVALEPANSIWGFFFLLIRAMSSENPPITLYCSICVLAGSPGFLLLAEALAYTVSSCGVSPSSPLT